jgi:hypothetical protein
MFKRSLEATSLVPLLVPLLILSLLWAILLFVVGLISPQSPFWLLIHQKASSVITHSPKFLTCLLELSGTELIIPRLSPAKLEANWVTCLSKNTHHPLLASCHIPKSNSTSPLPGRPSWSHSWKHSLSSEFLLVLCEYTMRKVLTRTQPC